MYVDIQMLNSKKFEAFNRDDYSTKAIRKEILKIINL